MQCCNKNSSSILGCSAKYIRIWSKREAGYRFQIRQRFVESVKQVLTFHMMYHIMKHQNSEYKYLFLILAYNLTADTYIGTLVSECLAIRNVLRMQGSHKPFSYVAISFSPKHYLMCSRFCLDSASLYMENRWVCLVVCLCVS